MNKTLLLLLTGIAVGVLIAPRKGSETWEMILDRIDELKGNAADEMEDVAEQASDLGEKAARKGKRMARDLRDEGYATNH